LIFSAVRSAPAQVNVVTQHNDLARTGQNLSETALTPSNVNLNEFGLLFRNTVDNQVYAQPLVVSAVSIGGGTHNVVYVATTSNSVYAFDGDTGTQYWHVNLGTPVSNADYGAGCVDINDWSCRSLCTNRLYSDARQQRYRNDNLKSEPTHHDTTTVRNIPAAMW
jgi:hypothetical protein